MDHPSFLCWHVRLEQRKEMERFLQQMVGVARMPDGDDHGLNDETVVEYLKAAAGCGEDASKMDFEDFLDLVESFVPGFELEQGQWESVKGWYEALDMGGGMEEPAACEENGALEKVVDIVAPCSKTPNSSSKHYEARLDPKSRKDEKNVLACPKLEQLLTIAPDGASLDALKFLLKHHCNNDVDAAATFMLDHGMRDVENLLIKDRIRRQKREEEALLQAKKDEHALKKTLIARYDEYVVKEPTEIRASQLRKAQRRAARQEKQERMNGMTRYLDGQIVSRKGEKYTVLDSGKPEWNGGSKGRVVTKGKRGPGFVAG